MPKSSGPILVSTLGESLAESLALRSKQGDRVAFAELVRRFEPRLHSFILERVRCHADASDLTQSAFLKAWIHIGEYSPRWKFSTWLFVIGHRLAISHLRTRKRSAVQSDIEREASAPATRIDETPLSDIWRRARESLQDDAYTVLLLRYAHELSTAEIAQVIDRSEVAVRVTLFRARRRLAEIIPDTLTVQAEPSPTIAEFQQGLSC